MNIPEIKMSDGNKIPRIGLGLWKNTDPEAFSRAFDAAIKAGYRHFDSAQAYGNEQFLGQAVKSAGINRKDLFITTKIAVQNFGDKKSRNSFDNSLKKLDTDYVDLLLLHFPVPALRKKTWKVAEDLKSQGLVRSIGVSNYTVNHLKQLEEYATELPVINQVEMHVFLQQDSLNIYCREKRIVVEAYSPIAHAKDMDNDTIKNLAKKYKKSYAQIMLRWAYQQDVVILPKSVDPKRIQENADIFDFNLSDTDIQSLKAENKNLHTCWNPELIP